MKSLDKDELYQNLTGFLKTKGIELTEGSYAQGIRKSCGVLSEAINLGQEGFERAKVGIDKHLDQMRQVIHEKTAPKPPATPPGPAPAAAAAAPEPPPAATGPAPAPPPKAAARKTAKRKASPRRRARR